MIKISKNNINTSNLNLKVSIYPNPLNSDTYADLEEEWFSWLPGFDTTKSDEDDEEPLFRENNIQLYGKLESITLDRFKIALLNMWSLLDSYLINSIHVAIDITGMLSLSSSSLAGYNYVNSNPQKGNYLFDIGQNYLIELLENHKNGKELKLKYNTVCEHEIIHLLDHSEIIKASVYGESDSSMIYYNYYLLGYRIEGIAELYYLLKGGVRDIKSMKEAKIKFKNNISELQNFILQNLTISFKQKQSEFKTYDFYELGPWIILDMLTYFEGEFHRNFIKNIIEKIESGEIIEHQEILDVIKIALRIKNEEFLRFLN